MNFEGRYVSRDGRLIQVHLHEVETETNNAASTILVSRFPYWGHELDVDSFYYYTDNGDAYLLVAHGFTHTPNLDLMVKVNPQGEASNRKCEVVCFVCNPKKEE